MGCLCLRRKHVVVHANHHWDEHDSVIEEMQFNPGKHQLKNAYRHCRTKEVVMNCCLGNQQCVLKMMPELNDQCYGPPLHGEPGEPLAEHQNPDQHHQGI